MDIAGVVSGADDPLVSLAAANREAGIQQKRGFLAMKRVIYRRFESIEKEIYISPWRR